MHTFSVVTSCKGWGGVLFSAAVKETLYSLSLIDMAIYGSVLDSTQYLLRTCLRCSYRSDQSTEHPLPDRQSVQAEPKITLVVFVR